MWRIPTKCPHLHLVSLVRWHGNTLQQLSSPRAPVSCTAQSHSKTQAKECSHKQKIWSQRGQQHWRNLSGPLEIPYSHYQWHANAVVKDNPYPLSLAQVCVLYIFLRGSLTGSAHVCSQVNLSACQWCDVVWTSARGRVALFKGKARRHGDLVWPIESRQGHDLPGSAPPMNFAPHECWPLRWITASTFQAAFLLFILLAC